MKSEEKTRRYHDRTAVLAGAAVGMLAAGLAALAAPAHGPAAIAATAGAMGVALAYRLRRGRHMPYHERDALRATLSQVGNRNAELEAEVADLRATRQQAAAVISHLIEDVAYDYDGEAQRAISYFSGREPYDEDFLPWPRKEAAS